MQHAANAPRAVHTTRWQACRTCVAMRAFQRDKLRSDVQHVAQSDAGSCKKPPCDPTAQYMIKWRKDVLKPSWAWDKARNCRGGEGVSWAVLSLQIQRLHVKQSNRLKPSWTGLGLGEIPYHEPRSDPD